MSKMLSSISILELTRIAAADISAHGFVGFDGRMAGDGAAVLGVAKTDAKAAAAFGVDVLGAIDMIAGAAISAGDTVQSNAQAQPIPKAAGAPAGVALTDAANPGDVVKILL